MISRFFDYISSRLSLRLKFSILMAFTISAASASLVYFIYLEGFNTLEKELRYAGTRMAVMLADRNTEFLMREETWELYKSVKNLVKTAYSVKGAISAPEYAAILNNKNRIEAHSNPKDFSLKSPYRLKGELLAELPEIGVEIRAEKDSRGWEIYHISAPMELRGERIGTAVIGISEKKLIAKLAELKSKIIGISVLMVSISIMLAHYLSRQLLKPLTRLMNKAQNLPPKITEGIRFDLAKGDEISQFTRGFDDIINRYGQMVDELKLEKEKLDGILNGIHAGMIVMDRDFKVSWQNRIHVQWFGDRLGGHCFKCSSDNASCEECTLGQLFIKEEILSRKMKRNLITGEERTFNIIGAPLHTEEQDIVGALMLAIDITHLVYLEDEIKKKEQLALIGQMAAGLAHEIRNPLGSLITALQIVTKKDGKSTQKQREKLLSIIQKETSRLNEILSDFLSFSQQRSLNIRKSDLNLLVDEIADILLHQKSNRPNLKIERNLQKELPSIMIDQDLFKQVIWNLALNGLDSMNENGGTLFIKTSANNGGVSLTIKDTGMGMDDSSVERCFEPFYTKKKGGTGLGLAIAKKIVDQHDGEIIVKSSVGKGTEFCVLIPNGLS